MLVRDQDAYKECYRGTPAVPGTGWFDRNGVERKDFGVLTGGDYKSLVGKRYTMYTPACSRCGGLGGSDKWAHTGWTCFQCKGAKKGESRPIRLYTADELAVLNTRRDALNAKKAEKRAAEAARIKAEQEASTNARKAALEVDPFYVAFRDLVRTFKLPLTNDSGYAYFDQEDPRRPIPDFLADMWKRIQHTDLSEKMQAAVQKFLDTRAAEQRRKENARHIGDEGARIAISVKVMFVKTVHYGEGYWDPSKYLIKLETVDGLVLTWFTQKYFEKGVTLVGKATVKAHKEYNGMKETQITNFRVSDEIAAGEVVEGLPLETVVVPSKPKKAKKMEAAEPIDERHACHCGSGLHKRPLHDARGIFCAYVCSKCEDATRAKYRPEIFTNSSYWTDEPVEAGDLYGHP